MAYEYRHVPGYSAYDHFADDVIARAQQLRPKARTWASMEQAALDAWHEVRPHPGIGPRIDVVKKETR